MAGLPRLPWLPRERAAKVRLPHVQRDRHDVPRLLVATSEGVEALLDFLLRPVTACRRGSVWECDREWPEYRSESLRMNGWKPVKTFSVVTCDHGQGVSAVAPVGRLLALLVPVWEPSA
jgi:hypothetical protein